MSTRAVTVTMDDSLARARELFNEHHFHHLLVVQGPILLLGIISDRDLLKAVSPEHRDTVRNRSRPGDAQQTRPSNHEPEADHGRSRHDRGGSGTTAA
jgi:CBS domain-containing protein